MKESSLTTGLYPFPCPRCRAKLYFEMSETETVFSCSAKCGFVTRHPGKVLRTRSGRPGDFLWDRRGNPVINRVIMRQRTCRVCGEIYYPRRNDQKQCSKRCAWRWHDINRNRAAKNTQQLEYKRKKRRLERAALIALRELGIDIYGTR